MSLRDYPMFSNLPLLGVSSQDEFFLLLLLLLLLLHTKGIPFGFLLFVYIK